MLEGFVFLTLLCVGTFLVGLSPLIFVVWFLVKFVKYSNEQEEREKQSAQNADTFGTLSCLDIGE